MLVNSMLYGPGSFNTRELVLGTHNEDQLAQVVTLTESVGVAYSVLNDPEIATKAIVVVAGSLNHLRRFWELLNQIPSLSVSQVATSKWSQ